MSLSFQKGNNLHPIAKIISGKYNGKTMSLNDKISDIDNTDFKNLNYQTIQNHKFYQMLK